MRQRSARSRVATFNFANGPLPHIAGARRASLRGGCEQRDRVFREQARAERKHAVGSRKFHASALLCEPRGLYAAEATPTYLNMASVCKRAHGVVVSHPLRMRKALGSNPSVSIFICFRSTATRQLKKSPNAAPVCQTMRRQVGDAWQIAGRSRSSARTERCRCRLGCEATTAAFSRHARIASRLSERLRYHWWLCVHSAIHFCRGAFA